MKTITRSFKSLALMACGVLFLSLLGAHATAGKPQPNQHLFWPEGAALNVDLFSYYDPYYDHSNPKLGIQATWPLATGADHYRLTIVGRENFMHLNKRVKLLDVSPASYGISPEGEATLTYSTGISSVGWSSYTATLTAYSDPDENQAYSESLQVTWTRSPSGQ
jgi:hypothetical protein